MPARQQYANVRCHIDSMKKVLIIILAFCASRLTGQTTEANLKFSVLFGSCFQNDQVGLKINSVEFVAASQISSDSINSITRLSAYQDNSAVWVTENDKKTKYSALTLERRLQLDIMLNGAWKKFNIDLRKGKIILINNCLRKKGVTTERSLTISQRHRTIQIY